MNHNTDQLRRRLPELLTPAKNKPFYICPLCGSGTGPHATGAAKLQDDGVHLKCFACDFYGDVFDLLGQQYGLDAAQAFTKAEEMLGTGAPQPQKQPTKKEAPRPMKDYSLYIDQCHRALQGNDRARDYLRSRGFTDETMSCFALGFDEATDSIVMPYGNDGRYFIRRSIEGKEFRKPPTDEAGPEPVFNESALYDDDVCFVVESQLCALSIEQAGGHAVAIGGGGINRLLATLNTRPTSATLVLALDNDDAGRANTEKLAAALDGLGVNYVAINVSGEHKDPNEALQHAPDALREAVAAAKDAEQAAYMQNFVSAHIDAFLGEVAASVNTPVIPTGFKHLDEKLDGGLYEGLNIFGSPSSMGKTTFWMQLLSYIAGCGRDVLIFSLEMSKFELMAKCISRITYERCNGDTRLAKTTRGIMAGQRYTSYSPEEVRHIHESVECFKTIGGNMVILEGCGDVGVKEVRESVQQHIKMTGNRPVVFIDYLQILAPYNDRTTDKQNMDRAVTELKRISRDFKIPVVAVSSLNRGAYGKNNKTSNVDMSDFKETGGIEYGADVLLALQFPQNAISGEVTPERIEALKVEPVRQLEIKVLKGRNGPVGGVVAFEYTPMYNHFAESRIQNTRREPL